MSVADKCRERLVRAQGELAGFRKAALLVRLSSPGVPVLKALSRAERGMQQALQDAEMEWADAQADEAVAEYDADGLTWLNEDLRGGP